MVGIVQHAIFRAATLAERRIADTREFLVGGRIPRTFGKFLAKWFLMTSSLEGESENRRVFTGDLNGGLGGLEPPTSPLSGPLRCYMHTIFFVRRGNPL